MGTCIRADRAFVRDRGLQTACFDALEALDPSLGGVMATSALTGLRIADMERLSLEAFDPGGRAIRPIFDAPGGPSHRTLDVQSLPMTASIVPIVVALVANARMGDVDAIVDAGAASRRWTKVKRRAGVEGVIMHDMRLLFAATAADVDGCGWGSSFDEVLWCRPINRLGKFPAPLGIDVRRLDSLFDEVAARLDHIARPAFASSPGEPGPAASPPNGTR